MMKYRYGYVALVLAMAALSLMVGCGSSISGKNQAVSASLTPASSEFPNAGLLVTPDSVQAAIASGAVLRGTAEDRAGKILIIDARTAGYETSHIPGAINVRYGDYFTAKQGLKPLAELESALGGLGIARDMKIVIYDNTTASWGAAGRIFWMLEYLGCADVHIINGGWDKWVADGRQTESAPVTLAKTVFTSQVKSSRRSTSDQILSRLQDSDFVVIDSRTDEEFVGWQLYGEARGGHIPNAVNIPYAWFFNSDKTAIGFQDLKSMLESRGITADKEVTAYCTAGIRSGYVYFLLRLMGYSRCSNYDASMFQWSSNDALPMEKAANYSRLVYPGWVKTLIGGGTPPGYAGKGYRILECSWGPTSQEYAKGHIPGAAHFDTNNVEARNYLDPENPFPVTDANEIVWDLVSDGLLQARIAGMGIGNDTMVIVYGSSAIATTRVYWALRYAGLDVRYLNGGYEAWLAGGGAAETVVNQPARAEFTINPQTRFKALTPEIREYADYYRANGVTQPGKVLVDVRSMQEYVGAVVGYNDPNITRKGRIPGAVWAYNADDTPPYYRDADGTLRSYTEVRKVWQDRGITPDKTLIFYCGTGWRSTLAFFYADLMGFRNIKNYDSWYVWSTYWNSSTGAIQRSAPFNDPLMPIDTGYSIQ